MKNETWSFWSSSSTPSLSINLLQVLNIVLDHFRNNPLIRFEEQLFPPFALENSYDEVEWDYKRFGRSVSLSKTPSDANLISSYVI